MQPSSNGSFLLVVIALAALAAGAYFVFGSSDDANEGSSGASEGISIAVGQLPAAGLMPTQTRPAQQPQTAPQGSAGDQVVTLNMQFTQTLVRSDGRCPTNVPSPGQNFSPNATSKVTTNKTKRTIQIENSDGTKSDVATYDAATGLALITYQGAQDNRTSTVKVTDTTLDGESTFFPYRGRQGGEQYNDCRFILKTTAKVP